MNNDDGANDALNLFIIVVLALAFAAVVTILTDGKNRSPNSQGTTVDDQSDLDVRIQNLESILADIKTRADASNGRPAMTERPAIKEMPATDDTEPESGESYSAPIWMFH